MAKAQPQPQTLDYKLRTEYLLRGSLGPSTVTFMALWYVATWGGFVRTVIVKVKLFPARKDRKRGGEGERTGMTTRI